MSSLQSILVTIGELIGKLSVTTERISDAQPQVGATIVASTGLGGRVQAKSSASIYADPVTGGTLIGTQPMNSLGTVMEGPFIEERTTYPSGCIQASVVAATSCTPKTTYISWKRVNFDRGIDGWIRDTQLMPALSVAFFDGSPTIARADTNVRSSPGGSIIGTQSAGDIGFINGSPVFSGEYVWWPVNYVEGVDGWTVQQNLNNPTQLIEAYAPNFLVIPAATVDTPSEQQALLSNVTSMPDTAFSGGPDGIILKSGDSEVKMAFEHFGENGLVAKSETPGMLPITISVVKTGDGYTITGSRMYGSYLQESTMKITVSDTNDSLTITATDPSTRETLAIVTTTAPDGTLVTEVVRVTETGGIESSIVGDPLAHAPVYNPQSTDWDDLLGDTIPGLGFGGGGGDDFMDSLEFHQE
jgi:hypothetical protein